ncbi:DUF4179 domain-containing protein [Clostridium tyrobutyricum]|uniref:DUF4179 domain-containing protein n=1 Tax=Clostridium tyrobutyricum TaxID=1519 RepID=UPI001C382772|nr:DUF4179 domain-containing protein [Clostridium tyrobutyricum]MBV4417223.1 DUF4179 domain-containing protein [Clostridium tyrobutyricum]MBV4421715.1 DUF4179 domain-containing protein [Clostridium tyrobutyricum]MBV4439809.1 DUF4179 domain-containing protein [Clostridium tyrobutyricum]
MDNIYKYLNDIEMDIEKIDSTDVEIDYITQKRLKRNLLNTIKNKRRMTISKYKVAAAAVIVIILIGVKMPAIAKNIPNLKSIIQQMHTDVYDTGHYEKYSKAVNKSITDKGITVTINEILTDGNNLMVGYTIKSDTDIRKLVKTGKEIIENQGKNNGFEPFTLAKDTKINGNYTMGGTQSDGKYLDEYTYINSETMYMDDKNIPSVFNMDLNINNIYGVKGNWNFKFSVSKNDTARESKLFEPNVKVDFPYGKINIEKISFTPVSTSIETTIPNNKNTNVNWLVFDDQDNEIEQKSTHREQDNNKYKYIFNSVNTIPKNLTIIPYEVNFNNPEYKNGNGSISISPIYKNIEGIYPIELSQGKMGKIIVESITAEKNKTIVKYKVEGKAPFLQAKELFILDDKGDAIEGNNSLTNIKKNNSNEYIMEFAPLNKDMKYKIGTNDLGYYEIRDDLKFKINLTK